MRQTLFYIPAEVFGMPVFGVGIALFLLTAALLVAGVRRFLQTRKIDEDLWSYLGLLLVGGGILVFVAPNVLEPRGFPIRGYGVCLLVAILAALGLVLRLSQRRGVPAELIFSLGLWTVVSGIVGARLFYVTEYWSDMVARTPVGDWDPGRTLFNLVNIANGGLVVFGGILGGILGAAVFMVRNRMPVLATFDTMAPAMMLGMAIGRIGCFLNGCCYGGPTDLCWGVVFPAGSPAHVHQIEHGDVFYYGLKFRETQVGGKPSLVLDAVQPGSEAEREGLKPGMILHGIGGFLDGKPASVEPRSRLNAVHWIEVFRHGKDETTLRFDIDTDPAQTGTKPYFVGSTPAAVLPVHPTQIYSSAAAAVLCVVLLGLGRLKLFRARDGLVFVAFLLLYSATRFGLEIIRIDEDSFLGTDLTVSQNVSIALFVAGCLLAVYIFRRRDGPTVP